MLQQFKNTINISIPFNESYILLNTINSMDLSDLRQWKNDHRDFFFTKNKISLEDQKDWFTGYLQNKNDFMFIVIFDGKKIGCIGVRLLDITWDIYNVILGDKAFAGRGIMKTGLINVLKFAYTRNSMPISLKVLKTNPAVGWYKNIGFIQKYEHKDYFELSINLLSIQSDLKNFT